MIQFNDNGSWSWFSEERAIVDAKTNTILIGSIGDKFGPGARDGSTEIAYFNVEDGSRDRFVLNPFLGSQGGNDHAHPVLDQLSDGRYIAAYANHGLDTISRFRVSTNPHDPMSWDNEVTVDNTPPGGGGIDGSTTYSNIFQLAGDGDSERGRLYNFNRSRGFDPNFNTSTDGGKTWQYGGRLLNDNPADPSGRNITRPYANYTTNGIDEIHFINTDNHPNNHPISNLYHGVIRDGKVYDSFGAEIDSNLFDIHGSLPSAPTPIFKGTTGRGGRSAWGSDIELDASGHPVVVFTTQVNNTGDDLRYHYARFDGMTWHTNEIAFAGRNALFGQTDYTGNISLDPNDLNTVYVAADVDPRTGQALVSKADGKQHFEIYKGVTTDEGATFTWTQVTKDSAYDNLRPVVPDWDEENTAVIWMRGLYGLPQVSGNYDRGAGFLDYDLAIVGLVEQARNNRGKIRYVDAETSNTSLANGGRLVTKTGPNAGADDRWHRQTSHGNGGYVYAAG
ncbi:MAG: BNR-4 repeat-containing protein, partial [Planctomycetota bacterium]